MREAAANLEFERAAALRDRLQTAAQPGPATGRGRAADGWTPWLEARVLEVQEYLRLLGQVGRGLVTRPIYARDIIEQLDAIGIGSLTVVILTGTFTGMVLALQSGLTLDQFGGGRWSAGSSARRWSRNWARC